MRATTSAAGGGRALAMSSAVQLGQNDTDHAGGGDAADTRDARAGHSAVDGGRPGVAALTGGWETMRVLCAGQPSGGRLAAAAVDPAGRRVATASGADGRIFLFDLG